MFCRREGALFTNNNNMGADGDGDADDIDDEVDDEGGSSMLSADQGW